MNEEIEKLIKLQGVINRSKFHLTIRTDLEKEAEWKLYQLFRDFDEYMRIENTSILNSRVDTIEDLISYLEKHDGISIK